MKMTRKFQKGKTQLYFLLAFLVLVSAAVMISFYRLELNQPSKGDRKLLKEESSSKVLSAQVIGGPVSDETYPKEWSDGGMFSDSYDKAFAKLKEMSLREKAGQIFLVRCPENPLDTIEKYKPSGFVLFRNDFSGKTKEQVIEELSAYQNTAQIPMLLAVDEEGGSVVRISSNPNLRSSPFLSPQQIFKQGGMEAIREDTAEKARLLKELGINLNLAPVADVSENKKDYIYDRTFGESAEKTSEYVWEVVTQARKNGLLSTLKHFPGYGNNRDTHKGIAVDQREYSVFENGDFLPFESGIAAGAESILVSHNIVYSMDQTLPASLSPKVHEILRKELHFTGVIMTDDLSMNAIAKYSGDNAAVVAAVLAGNDLLISSNFEEDIEIVITAVEEGIIPLEELDHAVFRVLSMKYHTKIME